MPYREFAYWYDALNGEADHDRLAGVLAGYLRRYGVPSGIVADLGCGTGELALRLADIGYDMIGIDASAEMLSVFREKLAQRGRQDILLLCQRLEELDLYGTIRAAVSAFDTFNHLDRTALAQALTKTALFMEPGGLLLFDVNTYYKHIEILGNSNIVIQAQDDKGVECEWRNDWQEVQETTTIDLTIREAGRVVHQERITEHYHSPEILNELLLKAGFDVLEELDGEAFGPINKNTQRRLVVAKRN